jgi:hypothetical protein
MTFHSCSSLNAFGLFNDVASPGIHVMTCRSSRHEWCKVDILLAFEQLWSLCTLYIHTDLPNFRKRIFGLTAHCLGCSTRFEEHMWDRVRISDHDGAHRRSDDAIGRCPVGDGGPSSQPRCCERNYSASAKHKQLYSANSYQVQ